MIQVAKYLNVSPQSLTETEEGEFWFEKGLIAMMAERELEEKERKKQERKSGRK